MKDLFLDFFLLLSQPTIISFIQKFNNDDRCLIKQHYEITKILINSHLLLREFFKCFSFIQYDRIFASFQLKQSTNNRRELSLFLAITEKQKKKKNN